ncbi:prothrombin-like [Antedon mediterranea]|uniref:prothrombin-like n=1 Tax=Antedon mediterranea TaxID=105859 RepID=UPI003AF69F33
MTLYNYSIVVAVISIFLQTQVGTGSNSSLNGGRRKYCLDNRAFQNGWIRYELDGAFYSQRQLVPGTRKTFGCKSGFSLVGNRTILCGRNGKWSNADPTCVADSCWPLYEDLNNYEITVYSHDLMEDGKYTHGTGVQTYCKFTYVLTHGDGATKCVAGDWLPYIPFCRPYNTSMYITTSAPTGGCQAPFIWSGTLLGNHGDIIPTGTFVEYECMPFAEKTEEGDIRCLDGVWYPSDPGCREKSCDVPVLSMGLYIKDYQEEDFFLHGSMVTFGCFAEWQMQGEESAICWYGQWSVSKPTCTSEKTSKYRDCGLAGDTSVHGLTGRIIGGFDANRGAWPWQAGIYWQDERKRWHFFCGGSLIDNDWVMSAGHCFGHNEDVTKIQVRLGTTNRTGDRGTNREQVFLIDALYLPKQHDFRGFDYDIAVMHLKRDVALNRFIHSICLPPEPESESSNQDGLVEVGTMATVVGWGHHLPVHWNNSELIFYKDDLQQLTIPIRPRNVCIASLRRVNEDVTQFTNTMFCAGFNKKAKDTCFGDSGGPLMRNVMYNGKKRWVQVGIVSAGKGCAISGQYAYYAHVPKLVPWVNRVMKSHKPTQGKALIQV